MTFNFKLQISRQAALLVLVPLVVELIFLILMAGMLNEKETELQNVLHSQAIKAKSNELSNAFNGAGAAIGGYSITRSPLFADRFDKSVRLVSEDLNELTRLVGDDKTKQETLSRIKTISTDGIKILSQAKSEIEKGKPTVVQFHARAAYKESRRFGDQLRDELLGLDEQHRKIENSPSVGQGLVVPIMLFVSVLLSLFVVCLLFGSMKGPTDK